MADFTSTTHATWQPEIWSDETQMSLESNIAVSKYILMTNEVGQGNRKGDVLHRPKVTDLTASDITDNSDIDGEANTEGEVTLTLNKKKHASVYIPKHLANNLAKYDFRQPYTHKIGYALAKRYDLDTIAALEAIGSPNTVGAVDASAVDVTDGLIRDGMVFLDINDIPMDNRAMVFYPDQRSALLGIAKYVEKQTAGADTTPIMSGKVFPVYGMPTEFSTLITQAGTTPNFYRKNFLLHKDAIWSAKPQDVDLEYNYIPRRKAWLLSGDMLYGHASYRGAIAFVIIYTDN